MSKCPYCGEPVTFSPAIAIETKCWSCDRVYFTSTTIPNVDAIKRAEDAVKEVEMIIKRNNANKIRIPDNGKK